MPKMFKEDIHAYPILIQSPQNLKFNFLRDLPINVIKATLDAIHMMAFPIKRFIANRCSQLKE